MDKNQPFFDPYNFNLQNANNPNIQPGVMPNTAQNIDPMIQPVNPAMYYEQQYMYYKYLTQMLEYKMKLKEWENMNREKK